MVPITSTRHGSPTEVDLDVDDGLEVPSCANPAKIQTVPKRVLVRYVSTVHKERLAATCEALAIASGCG